MTQSRSLSSDSFLITPAELHAIPQKTRRILDTTWFMPNSPRNAREEFNKLRIPDAQYLDLDEVASPNEMGLKHMMPSPQQFRDAMEGYGIKKDDTVILYDTHGIFSSPRALFMFKAFKHDNAWVLDGGLPAWRSQGYELDQSEPSRALEGVGQPLEEGYPIPNFDTGIIRSYDDILGNTKLDASVAELVLDARPTPRFRGDAPEPRPGLASGHMPNSVSIPFSALLESHAYDLGDGNSIQTSYTTLLPRPDLKKALVNLLAAAASPAYQDDLLGRILRGTQPVVCQCGSGMTAGIVWLALKELGIKRSVPLYDESWTGYASRKDSPIIVDV